MTIVERAVVERWSTYGLRGMTWLARHDECGWCEELTEWHNAFWAADHHVRHDCGRRKQVSSGGYVLDIRGPRMTAEQEAEFVRRWRGAERRPPTWLNKGGRQKHPTPSDNGHPLVSGSADDPGAGLPLEGR